MSGFCMGSNPCGWNALSVSDVSFCCPIMSVWETLYKSWIYHRLLTYMIEKYVIMIIKIIIIKMNIIVCSCL